MPPLCDHVSIATPRQGHPSGAPEGVGKAWEGIGGKGLPTLRLQRPASNPLASADMRHQTRDSALSPLVSSSLGDLPTLAPSMALPRR